MKNKLLLTALTVLGSLCLAKDNLGTCPHEVDGLNADGYRTSDGNCVTLVSSEQLQKFNNSKIDSPQTEQAMKYCIEELNSGSLMFPLKDSDLGAMTSLSKFDANYSGAVFGCTHAPYANCILQVKSECLFDKNIGGCTRKNTIEHYAARQPPYGKDCSWKVDRSPCKCEVCTKAQWEPWRNYSSIYGKTFRTRYRPFDGMSFHSCSSNSTLCCGEFHSNDKLEKINVGCLNGGYMINTVDFACRCQNGFTGMLCELTRSKEERSPSLFSDINIVSSNYLIWPLLFCILISILLFMATTIRCLQSTDDHKKKVILINIDPAERTENVAQVSTYYSYEDDIESWADRRITANKNNIRYTDKTGSKTLCSCERIKCCRSKLCRCGRIKDQLKRKPKQKGHFSSGNICARRIINHL